MNEKPILNCGHAANSTHDGKPSCAICFGIYNTEISEKQPDLSGRDAFCFYCGTTKPSNSSLPFFEHVPNKPRDAYYCGCRGWD